MGTGASPPPSLALALDYIIPGTCYRYVLSRVGFGSPAGRWLPRVNVKDRQRLRLGCAYLLLEQVQHVRTFITYLMCMARHLPKHHQGGGIAKRSLQVHLVALSQGRSPSLQGPPELLHIAYSYCSTLDYRYDININTIIRSSVAHAGRPCVTREGRLQLSRHSDRRTEVRTLVLYHILSIWRHGVDRAAASELYTYRRYTVGYIWYHVLYIPDTLWHVKSCHRCDHELDLMEMSYRYVRVALGSVNY